MRDKLIHDYFNVDLDTVWETAKKEIPFLLQKVELIIEGGVQVSGCSGAQVVCRLLKISLLEIHPVELQQFLMYAVHAIKNGRQAGVQHAPRARTKVIIFISARRACAMPGVDRRFCARLHST